ncbi:MAG: hypothetical protein K2X27_21225, partial [Candidatus Obscuribacterales bacterium]|nr:hypothetical protein [Candidatus Obscuribacterales bacterium]
KFEKSGAQFLVTTEKDRVRLPDEFIEEVPLAELALSSSWGDKAIVDIPRLRSLLKRKRQLSAAAAR